MKKSKRKKPSAKSAPPAAAGFRPVEDRTVLALTVAWMLAALCSLAAELILLVVIAIEQWTLADDQASGLQMAAGALLLAAVVTGVLCLVLTPLVWRMRPDTPPWPIMAGAILVGILPLATLGLFVWLS